MNSRYLIISGGEYGGIPEHTEDTDIVIACDHGYDHAMRAGLIPDVFIGDFDSVKGEISSDTKVIRLPHEKDDSDTHYAVKYALSEGSEYIMIACALGGRFDHAFSNIQSGIYAAQRGCHAVISGSNDIIHIFSHDTITLPEKEGWSLSVYSLSDKCLQVNITGALYPLKDAVLVNAYPIGTSNEWTSDAVTVSVGEGIIMVCESRMS